MIGFKTVGEVERFNFFFKSSLLGSRERSGAICQLLP